MINFREHLCGVGSVFWQENPCLRPLPLFARDINAASVRLNNPLANGQPQSAAVLLAAAGFVHTVKSVKHKRDIFLRDADAVVGDCQDNVLVCPLYRNIYIASGGRVFNGVVQHIIDDLAYAVGVNRAFD